MKLTLSDGYNCHQFYRLPHGQFTISCKHPEDSHGPCVMIVSEQYTSSNCAWSSMAASPIVFNAVSFLVVSKLKPVMLYREAFVLASFSKAAAFKSEAT